MCFCYFIYCFLDDLRKLIDVRVKLDDLRKLKLELRKMLHALMLESRN